MKTLYQMRREALFRIMEENGVNKLLVGKPLNIFYLSGIMIKPYERFVALLLDSTKQSALMILPSLEQGIAIKHNIQEVLHQDNEDPVKKLAECLGNVGMLGMEMNYFPLKLGSEIKKACPKIQLQDIGNWISDLRMCKNPEEIEKIHTSARYGDEVLAEVKNRIAGGCSEKELLFALFQKMSAKPGVMMDEFVIQVLSGENTANPHGFAGDRMFQKGDSITIDYGVYYDHYWSDYCRNFFLGKPDPRFETIYQIVLEAQLTAIETVRPGIPMKDIDAAARRIITKAGYGENFTHRTGHGIGLDIHEDPKIHSDNEAILQEGMVFTIEPGIYIPRFGGVRIEDDIAVTKNGAMVLNSYPKELKDMILG